MGYYCSKCKKDIPEKVYEYSLENYGKVFCRDCQKLANTQKDTILDNKVEGLSEDKSRFTEGMIKGRIAETLIEELFLSLNYNVFR